VLYCRRFMPMGVTAGGRAFTNGCEAFVKTLTGSGLVHGPVV
jgi:hypothetical protein